MAAAISPFAPATYAKLAPIAGVRLASHACGIRYQGRDDLMVAELAPGTTAAGVFTRSLTASAPVLWCRSAAKGGKGRLVVVNSGNANAFNGVAGIEVGGTHHQEGRGAGQVQAEGSVRGVHRHDRRSPRRRQDHRRAGRRDRQARRRRLGQGGARHHDHRHLSQARHPRDRDRRRACAHQRVLQGLGHDRARHGDHARLRLHRRQAAGGDAASTAVGGNGQVVQLHHGGQRHLDQRHAAAFATGQAKHPRVAGAADPALAISRPPSRTCCSTWRCRP